MSRVIEYDSIWTAPTYDKAKPPPVKTYSLPAPFNKANDILEADILKDILKVLKENNIWHKRVSLGGVIHGNVMAANPMKGMPDIIGCHLGNMFGIEVKRFGGKVDAFQMKTLTEMREASASVCIATGSKDIMNWMNNKLENKIELEGIIVI